MIEFSVAPVISDYCVLQRNKNISIFGTAPTHAVIKVELFNNSNQLLCQNSTTATTHNWLVQLEPLSAQNDCVLKISCGSETKFFSHIDIGEVWLAGGQSNMEFELQNCTEGPDELAKEKSPNVRFYYTNKIAWKDQHFYEAEKNTCWQTWDSQWKTAWSAVGYFFGKKLAADLNVTVGVIGCNWGGTSASAWMNKESLEKDVDLKTYLDEQEEATKGKSIEQQLEEYDNYEKENAIWQEKCNHLYATEPGIEWDEIQKRIGPCVWPGPKSCKNPYRPTGLYECMLQRIMPYTLKGVIWYQGESDDHKPASYAKLFSTMIDLWRNDWMEPELPFIFVQLPEHRYKQDKDFKHWCFVREAQQKVHNTVKNAFMACALDLGQYNDIHPKAKKMLAERMENISLSYVYNQTKKEEALSPMLESTLIKENSIILTFKHADSGFEVREDKLELDYYKEMEANQGNQVPENFTGFEVAGADGIYYPAEYHFNKQKLNSIILTSSKVSQPIYARYAWYNYGPVTIFGKNGLPLAPFRTSTKDEQASVEHAAIQQIMTVG